MSTDKTMPGGDRVGDDTCLPRRIELKGRESLEEVAAAMRRGETFVLVTDDPNFNPLSYDLHSAHVWIGAAGGGILMTIGGGALVLAFLDPEPTSKLTALVVAGTIMALAGGGIIFTIIFTILVSRSGYRSVMRFDQNSGKYEWVLRPNSPP